MARFCGTKIAVGESGGILVLSSYFQNVLKLLKLFWNFHMARFSGTNLSLQESAGIFASQLFRLPPQLLVF